MSRRASAYGYDFFSTITREVWADATRIVAEGGSIAARRRARRRGLHEVRRGDYFTARACFRAAMAIEWLSSPKRPRQMPIH